MNFKFVCIIGLIILGRELYKDFDLFVRRMRLQYIYYGKEREPLHMKTGWNPPVQPSVVLETFLEEVKLDSNFGSVSYEKQNGGRRRLTVRSLQSRISTRKLSLRMSGKTFLES